VEYAVNRLSTALMLPFLNEGPLLAIGNKKVLSALVVDLRSGDVLHNIVPERGFAGEPDDVAGANTWMRALFEIAPDQVRRMGRRTGSPRPEKPVRHPRPRKDFVITSSMGWTESDDLHTLYLLRHRPGIESISVKGRAGQLPAALRCARYLLLRSLSRRVRSDGQDIQAVVSLAINAASHAAGRPSRWR
jgi:hypothetical protein